MRQKGWALAGVLMISVMMSAALCAAWMDLAGAQTALDQRAWLLQSRSAAQALIRDLHSGWDRAPAAPLNGCVSGRCAWLGDAGLAKSLWAPQIANAATWGAYSGASSGAQWPSLPSSHMYGWLETSSGPDGILVRITAWVQGPQASQSTVLQAVWLRGSFGVADGWVSWREVLP